ncbi:MAG: hypothetical protein ACFE9L_16935 [Candidatus Hodarchaeota archaeon]
MKKKFVQRNRVVIFGIILFAIITLQSQANITQINASSSTMKQLKLQITRVQHTGGPYGSYGFNIVAHCKWRRVYNNYWGKWTSDDTYADFPEASSYQTGVITSIDGDNGYSVYSDYCYGEVFQIQFKVWKRGIWFGFLTDEGKVSMGTKTYSSVAIDKTIPFEDGDFVVTVTYSVYD